MSFREIAFFLLLVDKMLFTHINFVYFSSNEDSNKIWLAPFSSGCTKFYGLGFGDSKMSQYIFPQGSERDYF